MPSNRRIFADNALAMLGHGLAVLPIGSDRTPLVSGFGAWTKRPGSRTTHKWIADYPDANIAIVPGLSGVIVADCDDASQDRAVEDLLGSTPLMVATNRGRHRYFRAVAGPLPTSLRSMGLNVDLKAGNSLVIAPPSVHESGHIYHLEGCDWSAIHTLPPPILDKIAHSPFARSRSPEMRDGSRGQWLNDQLCRHASTYSSLDHLLEIANELNNALVQIHGLARLPDEEVSKRAVKVWRDLQAGKLRPLEQYRGKLKTDVDELHALCLRDPKHGPDALVLLLKLRAEHAARCSRGDTFSLTTRAMAESSVITGWSRERYEHARRVLLDTGKIVLISRSRNSGGKRTAAQYQLAEFQTKQWGAGG